MRSESDSGNAPANQPVTPTNIKEGAIVATRFRLVRVLGTGGMGSVWLADHLGLGVPCAVKFIEGQGQLVPELVGRLGREAKVEAHIRGPHVVHILDHGVWCGAPYIAMEYLEGETLAQRLQREPKLDAETTHRIVAHVSRALTRAHALGVVHRDLKPENVFLVPGDDGVLAKVFDFGVAKCSTEWEMGHVTFPGTLIGTPVYMSPEQARGGWDVDARTDLWALAVIAYSCLTGHLPFVGDGLRAVLTKITHDPLPIPSAIAPELPDGFDRWWERAAARNPDERFQSAKDLADALADALGLSPAHAHVSVAPPGHRGGTDDCELAVNDSGLAVNDSGLAVHDPGSSISDQVTGVAWHSWRGNRTARPGAWLTAADAAVLSAVLLVGLLRRTASADEQWRNPVVTVQPIVMDLTAEAGDPADRLGPTPAAADSANPAVTEKPEARAGPASGSTMDPVRSRRASVRGSRVVETAAPAASANGGTKPRDNALRSNEVDFGI